MRRSPDQKKEADDFFKNYAEYAKTLRAWLVAFGIGGPVLFLTNKEVAASLTRAGHARLLVSLFLIGVALQVIGALINKWAAWYLYRGAHSDDFTNQVGYRVWSWINDQTWFDIVVDIASFVLFGAALTMLVFVFGSAPAACS